MKLWSALIGVIVIGALVIGCGGGGDETIAKAEYVEQGNAICKEGMKQRQTAEQDFFEGMTDSGKAPNQATIEKRFVAIVVPHLETMVGDLEELDEPDSGAADAEAVVASFQQGIKTLEDETAEVFKETVDPFEQAKKQATALGLKECASF